jgi:O-antigen/teichoic acid export membrane protein
MRSARFRTGILWNWASLAFLGAGGIALNIVVARFYDAATLGVFNQVLAAYVVISMLAAGGIHVSLLRALAAHRAEGPSIVAGALVPAFGLSAIVALLFYLARGVIAAWLESPAIAEGITAVAPGLFFFAINKSLLGAVNALERMRAFAVYQSLRYLLLLGGLVAAVLFSWPGARLPLVFTIAEAFLFAVLILEVSIQVRWWRGSGWRSWTATHLSYGVRSLPSGVLIELNSRVDVLMLGWFLADDAVGIYSFAVLFAEGFFQLQVVLQNSYNPIFARELAAKNHAAIESMVKRARRWIVPAAVAAGALAVLVYPYALQILTGDPSLAASHTPFAILVAGIVLASAHLPFMGTLTMANLPGWHTIFVTAMVATNAIGNAILIPIYGLEGAAIGTALALALSMALLSVMARTLAGVRL